MGLEIPLWKEFKAITQHNFECSLNEHFWKPLCPFFYFHIHRNGLKLYRDLKYNKYINTLLHIGNMLNKVLYVILRTGKDTNRLFDKIGIIQGSIRMMQVLTEICHDTYCTLFTALWNMLYKYSSYGVLCLFTTEKTFKDKEIRTIESELPNLRKLKKRSSLHFGKRQLTR